MFGLDLPSTQQITMPDWQGGIQRIGGWADSAYNVVYQGVQNTIVNPVEKQASLFTAETSGYVQRATGQAQAGFFNALSSILGAGQTAQDSLSAGVAAVASPITSGLKWGLAVVVIGLALYVFLLASPFLPHPDRR